MRIIANDRGEIVEQWTALLKLVAQDNGAAIIAHRRVVQLDALPVRDGRIGYRSGTWFSRHASPEHWMAEQTGNAALPVRGHDLEDEEVTKHSSSRESVTLELF